MTLGVYWFYQASRDRAVYVGSSVDVANRQRYHFRNLQRGTHRNAHLQNTWNKYGAADFQFAVLEECDPAILIEREQFWMNAMPSWPTCNIAIAAGNGMQGRKHSADVIERIRAAGTGRRHSDAARHKMSESRMGIQFSEEHIRKLTIANRRRIITDETREKLRVAGLGRVQTEETRKKISASHVGLKPGQATRKKMSESAKLRRRQKGKYAK